MAHLLNTTEPVHNFLEAVRFYSLMTTHRHEPLVTEHEHLSKFAQWHERQLKNDLRAYIMFGAPRGLIANIKHTHGWQRAAPKFVDKHNNDNGCGIDKSNTELGSRVDRELAEVFAFEQRTAKALMELRRRLHGYTIELILFFASSRWLPCAFQTPMWNADGTIRTWIDMIVYDVTNRYFVLVELKTGYHDTTFRRVLQKATPTDFFDHTPHIMCHLQLGWMYASLLHNPLIRRDLPGPFRPALLRVNSERQLVPESLDDNVLEYYESMMGVSAGEAGAHRLGVLLNDPQRDEETTSDETASSSADSGADTSTETYADEEYDDGVDVDDHESESDEIKPRAKRAKK